MVDGKLRNLQNRRYCLTCSPYGAHNTRPLAEALTQATRQKRAAEVRRAKFRKYQRKARRQRKRLLVEMLGGCCQICGYGQDCPSAYSFSPPRPRQQGVRAQRTRAAETVGRVGR